MILVCGLEDEKHKKIGREKTVILSSHILAEVEATCDRILIINKGKIVADGTARELRKKSEGQEIVKVKIEDGDKNDVFAALQSLGSIGTVDFIKGEDNMYEVQSKPEITCRKDIFKLCVDKGWVLTEMTPIETTLEDIFRDLTLN